MHSSPDPSSPLPKDPSAPLRGRVVVVTGAGRGLGRSLAEGFLRDGASVVGFGRTRVPTADLAGPGAEDRLQFVVGSLAVPADVERLFDTARARFGRVDVLVNNAAVYPRTAFLDTPIADFAEAMYTNVAGMAHCCMLALPGMLAAGYGRILNLGSLAWRGPIPGSASYSASKAAVSALTRAIAVEIDPRADVLVNEFLPGIVRTGMSAEGMAPADVYPHLRHVVCLPKGSPNGATYLQSELWEPDLGRRRRIVRWLKRALGRS